MNATLKAKNTTLSDSMKAYVGEKIMASVEKIAKGNRIDAVLMDIEVGKTSRHHKKGLVWEAQATVHMDADMFRAEAEGESFQEAVDLLEGELLREIKKMKGKKTTVMRKGARRAKQNATIAKSARQRI